MENSLILKSFKIIFLKKHNLYLKKNRSDSSGIASVAYMVNAAHFYEVLSTVSPMESKGS